MPFSKSFFIEVGRCAALLSDENKTVQMTSIYNGFYVSLSPPEGKYKDFEKMEFQDFGIEKEGIFYLVMVNFLGMK